MVTVAKSFEAPIKCKLSKQRERERERERERAFTPFLARILVEQITLFIMSFYTCELYSTKRG